MGRGGKEREGKGWEGDGTGRGGRKGREGKEGKGGMGWEGKGGKGGHCIARAKADTHLRNEHYVIAPCLGQYWTPRSKRVGRQHHALGQYRTLRSPSVGS
eukprot:93815-Rhodomonas_salina.2